ncbi:claudin-10-like [Mugil cephalus]|uniref:claudin-10-like n=1 Tax=Mugil cephalus TaxID=48193 RepID=UPI001FB5F3A8|nr:claudin-10-like [Mugil cephalus]
MWKRPLQILGLLLCLLGWVLVGCTLAMDHWRVAQLGGQGGSSVVAAAWFWSDLWRDCYEDSTALVNCVDFGVLWTVKENLQAVRGLLLTGLCLGLLGAVLTFFGMECTRVGGDGARKDGTLATACAFHLAGCASDVAGYCLYINRVVAVFLHSKADPSKLSYEMGPPLYLGLVGSLLIFLGCAAHCATVCGRKPPQRHFMAPSTREKHGNRRVTQGHKRVHVSSKRSRVSSYRMASVVVV